MKNIPGRGILLFYFACLCCFARAQECQWLTVAGGQGYERGYDIDVSDSNYVVAAGFIFDSLSINGNMYHGPNNSFLIKYDENGGIIWVKQTTGSAPSPGSYYNSIKSVSFDNQSNIYIMGEYTGLVDFGNGVQLNSLSTQNIKIFLAKLDPNGRAIWAKDAGARKVFSSRLPEMTVDAQGDVAIGFRFSQNDTMRFSGSSVVLLPLGNAMDIGVFKYNSAGIFQWAKVFGGALVYEDFTDIGCDAANNIYILGLSLGSFAFGTQILADTGQVILKISPAGIPVFGHKIINHFGNSAGGIAVKENGCFAIAGVFSDSVDFGSGTKLQQTGTGYLNNYLVYYDAAFNPGWAKKDDPPASGVAVPYGKIAYKNGNFYFGGSLTYGPTKFGNFTINYVAPRGNLYVVKADTLGNYLWAFSSGISTGQTDIYGISADQVNGCYLTGAYGSYINVFNRSAPGNVNEDFYAAKIIDYNIVRGPVFSGPYCAGDTIEVPYTKAGTFDTGNEFIAQLSDSSGNFTGGERELGRKTDTASGVIKGLLPMFNVATNSKYRIRIISTSPAVQSFYKADTLRLLIYSKDTANAGPDIVLCKGQQVRLSTTGGSKWQWSPQTYMPNAADTANRQPLVKPVFDTQYRIIISDSSGCGVTDTDYVLVRVRPDLIVTTADTINTCKGRAVNIKATAQGGDSLNYHFKWIKIGDTATLSVENNVTVNPDSVAHYRVILADSCSANDTAITTIVPKSGLTLTPFADTTICLGHSITFNANAFTCDTTAVKYVWNNGLGTGPVKTISPTITTSYKILAYDTINGSKDSAIIKVTVLPALKLAINADTAICRGETLQLKAVPEGGLAPARKIYWQETGGLWTDTNYTAPVSPAKTTTYTAVLSDNCTVRPDTATIVVTVRAALSVTVNADTTVCVGEAAQVRAVTTGGFIPGHKITWTASNSLWTDTNTTLAIVPGTTTVYTATLKDNCTSNPDSAKITVAVRPPLSITVSPDTTICTQGTATLTALPQGGFAPGYKLRWAEVGGGSYTDTNYTISVLPAATVTYRATLADNCTVKGDSSTVTVTVRPPLSVTLAGDDSICYNQQVTLAATISGGHTTQHALVWSADNSTWTSSANPATHVPQATTVYTATLSDNCSPVVKNNITIAVIPLPVAGFSTVPQLGCPPLDAVFTDVSVNNDTTLNTWKIQGTTVTGVNTANALFPLPGTYTIGLMVSNVLGCKDSVETAAVTVFEKPKASFTAKPDIIETGDEVFLLNTSQYAVNYLWNFGDGNVSPQSTKSDTVYVYADTGAHTLLLVAENKYGCKDTATKYLYINDRLHCALPNAFSPGNRDELNAAFFPVCTGLKNYTLTIYSRWGGIIFQGNNQPWDGTHEGHAVQAGIYVYHLQLTADSGKKRTLQGVVNIIK